MSCVIQVVTAITQYPRSLLQKKYVVGTLQELCLHHLFHIFHFLVPLILAMAILYVLGCVYEWYISVCVLWTLGCDTWMKYLTFVQPTLSCPHILLAGVSVTLTSERNTQYIATLSCINITTVMKLKGKADSVGILFQT